MLKQWDTKPYKVKYSVIKNTIHCNAPWVNRIIHSTGQIASCCYTVPFNIDIEKLKESFSAGVKAPQCSYCWDAEKNNMHSPRLDFSNLTGDTVTHLAINLGNYCNAECIMCNGNTSSSRNSWARIHNLREYNPNAITEVPVKNFNLTEYPDLTTLSLIGGEPAIHPSTIKILDYLIENDKAADIDIHLNTNSSKLSDPLIDQLRCFKSISVTLSIDGTGKYFEYQRRPLKWNQVKTIAEQWMHISENIVINYVVTAVSIWAFNDFISWFLALPASIHSKQPQIIMAHVRHFPHTHLTLNILTDEQKRQWMLLAVDHPTKQDIINILNSATYSVEQRTIFKEKIKLEDITSKIKFAEIFPDWDLYV